jgi:hypothetical protein
LSRAISYPFNFLKWIDAEFGMSRVTAHRLMQAAEEFGANVSPVKHLDPAALYLLAAPSAEPIREEVLARQANATERKIALVSSPQNEGR